MLIHNIKKFSLLCLAFITFQAWLSAQPKGPDTNKKGNAAPAASNAGAKVTGDPVKGQKLFEGNACVGCHGIDKAGTGPALRGVVGRHSSVQWVVKWVQNWKKLVATGDAEAIATSKLMATEMSLYDGLSDADVMDILAYIETAPKPVAKKAVASEAEKDNSALVYTLLAVVLILLSVYLILSKLKNNMRKTAIEKGSIDAEPLSANANLPWYKKVLPAKLQAMNPVVLTMFILSGGGLLLAGYGYKFGMEEIGVQKGYAPDQPIKFSHAKHAGELGLNCRYCHTGVEISKSATIPSTNTCMNCHKGIKVEKDEYGGETSPEIKKIYAALDYDDQKQGSEAFGKNARPVQWTRIHNLPDHAYFNHSQHVKVGKVECQECHGPIEKMDVVQQHSTLQMGWCIDCHRTRGVDVENNKYYEELHKNVKADIAKKGNKSEYRTADGKLKVTPAMNGGLECSKCHY